MFTYELAKGEQGKIGLGGLVWSAAESSFAAEPKVLAISGQFELTRELFGS